MILVVDDDPDVLYAVETILKKEGFEVETANDGNVALELLENHTPELILLDIMMPEVDGWEVLREIRSDEQREQIPVIMLTVKSIESCTVRKNDVSDIIKYLVRPFTREKMSQEGLIDRGAKFFWIDKPFNREVLVSKVKAILKEF